MRVTALLTRAIGVLWISCTITATFDCANPPASYSAGPDRYYHRHEGANKNTAKGKCDADSTQMAIAYTKDDYYHMFSVANNAYIAKLVAINGATVTCSWSPACQSYTFEWADGTRLDYPASPSWFSNSKHGVYMDNSVNSANWECTKMWWGYGMLASNRDGFHWGGKYRTRCRGNYPVICQSICTAPVCSTAPPTVQGASHSPAYSSYAVGFILT